MRTIIERLAALIVSGLAVVSPALSSAWAQSMMDDQMVFWRVDGLVERRASSVSPDTAWQASMWIGGDEDKLRIENRGVLRDDGLIDNEGGTEGIDTRLYYSHMIAPFWDTKAGVQFSFFDNGVKRSGFLAGVQGLAPYGVDVDLLAGINELGIVSGRLEARYDILFTPKLIAQPYVDAMVASADDPATGLGNGLARVEAGLRLRYEIEKEVAPFIGVSFEQFTGQTASFVAASGEPTSKLRALVGLKLWF
jgi:copper resistance protein B